MRGRHKVPRTIHKLRSCSSEGKKHTSPTGTSKLYSALAKKGNDETLTNALLTCDTSPALILHCQLPLCPSTCTLDKPSAFKYRMQLNYIYQSNESEVNYTTHHCLESTGFIKTKSFKIKIAILTWIIIEFEFDDVSCTFVPLFISCQHFTILSHSSSRIQLILDWLYGYHFLIYSSPKFTFW